METGIQKAGNNVVILAGEIVSPLILSHTYRGEPIYRTQIKVDRLSETPDVLWLMIPESLILCEPGLGKPGTKVMARGQLLSYNQHRVGGRKLILSISVTDLKTIDEMEYTPKINNKITLHGFVCKNVIYRRTLSGKEITEVILAVNRDSQKGDYIPCIFWGRNARIASGYCVGTELWIRGRIQSREYVKQAAGKVPVKMIAYEVSVKEILSI